MKKARLITLALLLTLPFSSTVLTGCSGCGTTNDNNMNDMVESTPAKTEEGIVENETTFDNNAVSDNTMINDNANVTDANGNPIAVPDSQMNEHGTANNDTGNIVGDAAQNVGDAARDVVDGVGNGVKSLVE